MPVIVFAVGRPGSGKSTAIRHIMTLAKSHKYITTHMRDYTILLNMSEQDEHREKFYKNEHNGFDVRDFSVLDIALSKLEKQIKILAASEEYDIILVEFARDSYKEAFRKLNPVLLENAYVLFAEARLDVCIERVYQRAVALYGPDHHFLSNDIMTTYYQQDHWLYMNNAFKDDFGIKEHCLKTIYNEGSLETLELESEQFAKSIFQDVCCQRRVKAKMQSTQEYSSHREPEAKTETDKVIFHNQEIGARLVTDREVLESLKA